MSKGITPVDGWVELEIHTHAHVNLSDIIQTIDKQKNNNEISRAQFDFFVKKLLLLDGPEECVKKWEPYIAAIKESERKRKENEIVNTLEGDLNE